MISFMARPYRRNYWSYQANNCRPTTAVIHRNDKMNSPTPFLFTKQPQGHDYTPQIIQLLVHLTENKAKGQSTPRWSALRGFPPFRETILQKPTLTSLWVTSYHEPSRCKFSSAEDSQDDTVLGTTLCNYQVKLLQASTILLLIQEFIKPRKYLSCKTKTHQKQVSDMLTRETNDRHSQGKELNIYQTSVALPLPYSHENNFNSLKFFNFCPHG